MNLIARIKENWNNARAKGVKRACYDLVQMVVADGFPLVVLTQTEASQLLATRQEGVAQIKRQYERYGILEKIAFRNGYNSILYKIAKQ